LKSYLIYELKKKVNYGLALGVLRLYIERVGRSKQEGREMETQKTQHEKNQDRAARRVAKIRATHLAISRASGEKTCANCKIRHECWPMSVPRDPACDGWE